MKWGRTHEIQTILWCIFQLSWPFDRVNSTTSVTVRQLSVTPAPLPTSVVFPCWKTRRCSCLPGTQDVLQAAQYLAIRNWQPLNCHSSKRLNPPTLNKTCQAKHADVTNKSRHLFVLAKKNKTTGTTDEFSLTIQISTRSVRACTRTRSTMYTHSLPTQQWLQKEQGDKTKWIADTSSLPCPLKLNYTCWGDERHITEPSD